MKKYTFQGKTFDEAKEKAMSELMEQEQNLYLKEIENISGIFNKKVVIEVSKKEDIIEFIKEYIKDITKSMGIDVNVEIQKRDDTTKITLFSENNAILIGKNGRTIDSLNQLIRQTIYKEINQYFNFTLDVAEYKVKQQKRIERLAKDTARDVAISKIEATLEPMNSYERRIVHSVLSDNKKVYTESIGEEPNRSVVIKPNLEDNE